MPTQRKKRHDASAVSRLRAQKQGIALRIGYDNVLIGFIMKKDQQTHPRAGDGIDARKISFVKTFWLNGTTIPTAYI